MVNKTYQVHDPKWREKLLKHCEFARSSYWRDYNGPVPLLAEFMQDGVLKKAWSYRACWPSVTHKLSIVDDNYLKSRTDHWQKQDDKARTHDFVTDWQFGLCSDRIHPDNHQTFLIEVNGVDWYVCFHDLVVMIGTKHHGEYSSEPPRKAYWEGEAPLRTMY